MKDSMIFYYEWLALINSLPDKERLEFYDNMMNPTKRAVFSSDNGHLKSIFDYVNSKVMVNEIKYQEIVQKRRLAASSGGKQKAANATNRKREEAIPSYNDNDNENDNENEVTNVTKKKVDVDLEIKMKFDSFWIEYPGHGANGARGNGYKGTKAKALEKFTKIINEGEDYEEIIRGCRAYTEHLNRSGYPSKHAATWLNQSGWKDDYAETIPANKNNKQSYGHEKPGYSDTLRNSVESAKEILRMGENGQGHEEGRENRISGNDAGIGGIPLLSFDASE